MTAQEGNYFTEIEGKFSGELMDVPFQAGPAILEAIRYYGLLKLQVYNMQWVAIAATAGGGAYSAMQDSSTMMLSMWNAMLSGFAEQIGEQLWQQAARYNPALFAGTSKRHRLTATPIEKEIPLMDMAALLPQIFQLLPMDDDDLIAIRRDDDDLIAIRRKLGFLSETLPEVEEEIEPEEPETDEPDSLPDDTVEEEDESEEPEAEMMVKLSIIDRIKGWANRLQGRVEMAADVSKEADDYGDKIAALIESALDGKLNRDEFEAKMKRLVAVELEDFARAQISTRIKSYSRPKRKR
jgi:hypothetical protein